MNLYKFLNIQLLFPVIFSLICVFIYDCFKNDLFEYYRHCIDYYFKRHAKDDMKRLYSSVICRGKNHTDRTCHFRNLCYEPNNQLYLFFHNLKSIKNGLPSDRFSPTLVDFSSVLDHNTQYFNYVDLPDTTLVKFNVTYVSGNYLMFKRFNPENLMHVFHDDLLPAFSTLLELYSIEEIQNGIISFIFADNRTPGPYKILYEDFLPRKPLYIKSLSNQYLYCFQNVFIGLNKYSTWYQYGFKEPQGSIKKPLDEIAPIILTFRDYFLQKFSISSNRNENYAVLLTRKRNRRLLNEREIKQTVSDTTRLKTIILSLDQHTVFEIISEIINCEIMIGVHGSLLILSMFLKPYSILLEIFPYGIHPSISTPYKTLTSIPGLKLIYCEWQNIKEQNSVPHPEYSPELGGILHLSEKKQIQIKNSPVLPFLCCDNPFWLYRVYQDTIIDIESFKAVLSNSLSKKHSIELEHGNEEYELYPSEIQQCSCNISLEFNFTLTISWKQPWNVAFMNISHMEYELWIEDVGTSNIQAYLIKKNIFHVNFDALDKIYYIWIRCYVNGYIGPFNSHPFICPNNLL